MASTRSASDKALYTTGDIARLSGVHINVVKRWIGDGLLEAHRLPAGHYRIQRQHYLSFLTNNGLPVPDSLAGTRTKVLVIDDDPDQRRLLCDYLGERDELLVEQAADGYDGLLKLGMLRPELVFLDIVMPRMDGFGMLDAIAQRALGWEPRIVVVTGNKNADTEARLSRYRLAGVLFRPYSLGEIDRVMEQSL